MNMPPLGLAESLPGAASRRAIRRVEVLVNPLAGHVQADAVAEAERILAELGLDGRVRSPGPDRLWRELREAVDCAPDVLVTLAGDGTARTAASLCGSEGPALAPLPGGTMNMLAHALYGPRDWKTVLTNVLSDGAAAPISGGEADGRRFHVAAILGAPALWAEAREAARLRHPAVALEKARNAWRRAFSHRVAYQLDGGPPRKSLALTLICPLVSRAMDVRERALEAAALDPKGIAAALRLGARTALSQLVGDWRDDPAVDVARCRAGRAWTNADHLPAILDGEPFRLHKRIEVRFVATAFHALVPAAGWEA